MNFLPARGGGDGEIALDNGGRMRAAVEVPEGRAITVGIRPEHAVPSANGASAVQGPVEMVEQLGADALVHVGHGGGTLIVRVPHGEQPRVGEPFGFRVEPSRVFVFDAASGRRVSA
jgi:multiple sugar transport system ATP-binding protein